MPRPLRLTLAVALGLAAALAALLLHTTALPQRVELITFDARAKLGARPYDDATAPLKVRVVLIDNASLRWMQRENDLPWPWPRDVYTYILDYCSEAGAKAFVFDAWFIHQSAMAQVSLDEALGQSIAKLPVFATGVLPMREGGHHTAWPDYVTDRAPRVEGLDAFLADPRTRRDRIVYPTADVPIPQVIQPPTLLGHVLGDADRDGVHRRAAVLRVFDGRVLPLLSLGVFHAQPAQGDRPPTPAPMAIVPGTFVVDGRAVPIDDAATAVLRFRAPRDDGQCYPAFSASSVIQSAVLAAEGKPPMVAADEFRDAVVFFGASATGLHDVIRTPVDAAGAGVTVHATALDNLAGRDFITRAPPWVLVTLTLAVAVAAALVATLAPTLPLALPGLLMLAAPFGLGVLAYRANLWWPVATPTLAALLAWTAGLAVNYATEGRHRRFLRRAFGQYLSPAVVEQLVHQPRRLALGGQTRTLSMLFSDMAGFSTICHALSAEQVTTLLNTYLTDMVDVLLEHRATVDKFHGDAVIAFWNAPLDEPGHAALACAAALACRRRLAERAEHYRTLAGGRDVHTRIGVHTGDVAVGNMGSSQRFDYTILGDAANLTSRLEGACKTLETRVLVSEATWALAGSSFVGRDLGRITVVGRTTPLRVFELVGNADDTLPAEAVAFELALRAAETGDVAAALAQLDVIAAVDPAAAALRDHLRAAGAAWEGVRRLDVK